MIHRARMSVKVIRPHNSTFLSVAEIAEFWIKMGKNPMGFLSFSKASSTNSYECSDKYEEILINFEFNRTQSFASSTNVVCRDTVMRTLCDATFDSILKPERIT